ncbi:Uma2 family endonuclease [Halomicronema sp. CCY15110]|uniref:Uma2 family endonuclease n=1 Tax=Halomicronema sp. CCY15110 TaxID=2767773 RepID=UPI001951FF90|nr:Uma2 family endonuclease [Halomicronema sp. CCY15110]
MVQSPTQLLSLDEFLLLPETEPASEFIDGVLTQKPMPQGKHSRLQRRFLSCINHATDGIAEAFPELRCTFAGRSIVPDVAVFQQQRIPLDETGEIANVFLVCPDWTIEILSPQQSVTRVTNNILHCLEHDAAMGWLVDPAERSILAYPQAQQPKLFSGAAALPVPEFAKSLNLTVEQVFGWLRAGS